MEGFFNSVTHGELQFLLWLHNTFGSGFTEAIMPIISLVFGFIIWAAAAAAMLIFKKTRVNGIIILIACSVTILLTQVILKQVFMRPRPMTHEMLAVFGYAAGNDTSFPSSHTALAFSGATSLVFYSKKCAAAAYILAVLTAFSRMYLCAHFPSDVIAGMLIGIVIAVITGILTKKIAAGIAAKKTVGFSEKM